MGPLLRRDRFLASGVTLRWDRDRTIEAGPGDMPVAARMPRFKGFHRFIPVLARADGFRVVEVPVGHRGRRFGRTHYGNLRRAWQGLRDVFGVAWLRSRRIDATLDE